MSGTARSANREWTMFLFVSAVLIGLFLWRLLTTAHEYPPRTDQVMTMVFDAGMLVGLVALRGRVTAAVADDPGKAFGNVLWWIALVAGSGLFAIRLTSNAAWWTGHLSYGLLPR